MKVEKFNKFFGKIGTFIGRTVVYHKDFKIRECLIPDRFHTPADIFFHFVHRHDH